MYCMYCGKELTQIEDNIYYCTPCDSTFKAETVTENNETTIFIEDISEE